MTPPLDPSVTRPRLLDLFCGAGVTAGTTLAVCLGVVGIAYPLTGGAVPIVSVLWFPAGWLFLVLAIVMLARIGRAMR